MGLFELEAGRYRDVYGPIDGRVIKVLRTEYGLHSDAEAYVGKFEADQALVVKHLGKYVVPEEVRILPDERGGWKVISGQEFIRGVDLGLWNKRHGIEPEMASQLTEILDGCIRCSREADGFVDYLGENKFDIEWRRTNESALYGNLKDKASFYVRSVVTSRNIMVREADLALRLVDPTICSVSGDRAVRDMKLAAHIFGLQIQRSVLFGKENLRSQLG